jgi:hypothetical protein
MKLTGENRSTVPVPLCAQQIPHGLTRDRTRASAVRGRPSSTSYCNRDDTSLKKNLMWTWVNDYISVRTPWLLTEMKQNENCKKSAYLWTTTNTTLLTDPSFKMNSVGCCSKWCCQFVSLAVWYSVYYNTPYIHQWQKECPENPLGSERCTWISTLWITRY